MREAAQAAGRASRSAAAVRAGGSLVAYEWHALRTLLHVRVVVVLAVVVILLALFATASTFALVPGLPVTPDDLFVALLRMNTALPVGVVTLAVTVTVADARRGLVLPAILRAPGRERVWFAKVVVAAAAAAALTLVACAGGALAVLMAAGPVSPGVLAGATGRLVLYTGGWAVLGVGVASLVRQPLAAVTIPVTVAFLVEPALATYSALSGSARWLADSLPFAAGAELVVGSRSNDLVMAADSVWVSGAVFLGACLAVAAVGFMVFRRVELVSSDAA